MLQPKRCRLRDYNLCFYGHAFSKEPELRAVLEGFLQGFGMVICPPVRPGQWLWQGLITGMNRCAFCVFETVTSNRNAHIELGYALARNLRVLLFIHEAPGPDDDITRWLPSDLAGFVQVRFRDYAELPQKLAQQVPSVWCSVDQRLGELVRQTTDVDRSFLRALLSRPVNRPIEFHELVVAPDMEGIRGSSNNAVAEFLCRYDELIEIDRLMPLELAGGPYDAWEPPSPDDFARQRIRVAGIYQAWLRNALGLPGRAA